MLESVIFDFDGLLIDTESCDYQAWLEIYREYELDYPLHEWQKLIGRYFPVPEPLERLDRLKGPLDRDFINHRRMVRSLDLALQQPLLQGVPELLNSLEKAGISMAIASSSPRIWLDHFLSRHRIWRYFMAIVTGNMVVRVKPYPDLFLMALEKLGCDKTQTLVLEDSRNGLLAAKAAGLRCVIIPSTLTRGMDFRDADLVVEAMDAISVEKMQSLLLGNFRVQEEKKCPKM